jgi:hypothetical protein
MRECARCTFQGHKRDYTGNQWKKGEGYSLCPSCAAGGVPSDDYYSSSDDGYYGGEEERECRDCYFTGVEDEYSVNQWRKGPGDSLCGDCAAKKRAENGGGGGRRLERKKFFHGTSWIRAQKIERDGFTESQGGLLGPGVYVAGEDKARRFAWESDRHGSKQGALITVLISYSNPKYVSNGDINWHREGYDACRTARTSLSTNMEWCVRSASQVEVVRIEGPFDLRTIDCPVCAQKKFANLHHAVQHVESGYCSGWCVRPAANFLGLICACVHATGATNHAAWCGAVAESWCSPGVENARQQVFNFAQANGGPLMLGDRNPTMQLDRHGQVVIPDKPYECDSCRKGFAQLGSLMSHKRSTGH